jgi:hypothetical protein
MVRVKVHLAGEPGLLLPLEIRTRIFLRGIDERRMGGRRVHFLRLE